MKSFTESKALLCSITKVATTDTNNVTLLVQFLNDSIRTMCNIRGGKWWFLETTKDVATVASQRGYAIPAKIRKLMSLYVTVGTTVYQPTPVYDNNEWNSILAADLGEDDMPRYYYVQGRTVQIAPTPASTSGTITMRGRLAVKDLSIADYTTGTISTLANGGTAVTGSGTTFTAAMADGYRYLRITDSDSALKGDGFWYPISAYTSATAITLGAPYQGTALAAASAAYTIGQMTPIPEAYDMAPIFRAAALYAQINDPLHPQVAVGWWRLYDGGQEAGLTNVPGGLIGQMIENESSTVEASYLSPNSITHNNLSDNTAEITGI